MKLTYRGTNYQLNVSAVETTNADMIVGTYRGATYRVARAKSTAVIPAPCRLIYRGVCYQPAPKAAIGPTLATSF